MSNEQSCAPGKHHIYILAGGKSRRFGSDKAIFEFEGKPLVLHVADGVSALSETLTVVAESPDKYSSLGLHTIADITPHQGPLGGLKTALTHRLENHGDGIAVLIACDFVKLDPKWIEVLVNAIGTQNQCAVFCNEYLQPFPGIYHTSLLPAIDQQLESEDHSLQRLLKTVETISPALPTNWPSVYQINSPEDVDRMGS